jgi:brefeldin A-inhibited guanine nucleotide-exchange protein
MMITTAHCEVHEASLLLSVRACFHIHLISKNLINKTTAKAALTQIISVTHQRMETSDADLQRNPPASPTASETQQVNFGAGVQDGAEDGAASAAAAAAGLSASQPGGNQVFPSVYHKDAYLLFRALCKLSMKGLSEETQYAHTDAIPLQNK